MHATHTTRKNNYDATVHALYGKNLTITLPSGLNHTGRCNDVVPSRNPSDDVLVRVDGCDDYTRQWKNAA